MSQENVDAARRILTAVTERDLAVLTDLTDPDVAWRSFFAALFERGEYRGHGALRQYLADLDDAFELIRPEPVQMVDVGDVVVGIGHVRYRGRASGVERVEAAGWVFEFDGRKVTRWRAFREPDPALAGLLLSGEANPG